MKCKYIGIVFLYSVTSAVSAIAEDNGTNSRLIKFPHPEVEFENKHKPIFADCSKYSPVLKEEEPLDTFVIQVEASKNESYPPHEGGTITYSLDEQPAVKPKFKIDSKTGVITTKWIFDRDEPNREHMAYLTVRATDNGHPQLATDCTFVIIIEDINDNPPEFDKVHYRKSVRKDMDIGESIIIMSATDIDYGNNSIIKYSISSLEEKKDNYFEINEVTGVIFLNKFLADKKSNEIFQLVVMAQDLGNPPKSSSTKLQIEINDDHKDPSIVKILPGKLIRIHENFRDFNATLFKLEAVSNIENEPALRFYLVSPVVRTTIEKDRMNMFRLETSRNTAVIKLSKMLDYEKVKEYKLIIRIFNIYNLCTETRLKIKVLDVNDNVPVFRKKKKASILENQPAGVEVMQVRATDADKSKKHNRISYKLGNYNETFAIDAKSGIITALTSFNKTKKDSYDVKVIASDNSPSALFGTGESNRVKQIFFIKVLEEENKP